MPVGERNIPFRIFKNHDAADRADDEYYASLTGNQRVDLMIEMNRIFAEAYGAPEQRLRRVYRIVKSTQSWVPLHRRIRGHLARLSWKRI